MTKTRIIKKIFLLSFQKTSFVKFGREWLSGMTEDDVRLWTDHGSIEIYFLLTIYKTVVETYSRSSVENFHQNFDKSDMP